MLASLLKIAVLINCAGCSYLMENPKIIEEEVELAEKVIEDAK